MEPLHSRRQSRSRISRQESTPSAFKLVGFDTTSLPVIVRSGQVTDLGTIALHRSSGTLQVTTDPAGAQILLGDRELGRTPLTVKLASGAYQAITAHLDGYVDTTFNATVTPDQTVSLPPMILKPEPPSLAVSTEPTGVPFQVFADSACEGRTGTLLRSHTCDRRRTSRLVFIASSFAARLQLRNRSQSPSANAAPRRSIENCRTARSRSRALRRARRFSRAINR
jgi:hypothetical protein